MPVKLAIEGGSPIRSTLLPYGHQSVSEEDIAAVNEVLRSDWLTTGKKVGEFEHAFASVTGAKEAVVVNSGTAALHCAYYAAGIRPGDEVIVPAMTFSATVNAAVCLGAKPVFCDCEPDTLLIDAEKIEKLITNKTKAVVAVDYAGQSCDYDALRKITSEYGLMLMADSCHALGGNYKGRKVGSLADLNTFSFHPVKPITTGEGGMITTDSEEMARQMRQFRNHNITSDHRERQEQGSWAYEMSEPGMNYRLTDFQCALGMSQLNRLDEWTKRRQEIAQKYDWAFSSLKAIAPLKAKSDISHAYHLYVIRINPEYLHADREKIFQSLRAENIGANVHYIPVHLLKFYRERFSAREGLCPAAELAFRNIITLPLFSSMSDSDAEDVIEAVKKVHDRYLISKEVRIPSCV